MSFFVANKSHLDQLRDLMQELREKKRKELEEHVFEHRPWGFFTVLESSEKYKVKRLTLLPGRKISLQIHQHRSEHWVVVSVKHGSRRATKN